LHGKQLSQKQTQASISQHKFQEVSMADSMCNFPCTTLPYHQQPGYIILSPNRIFYAAVKAQRNDIHAGDENYSKSEGVFFQLGIQNRLAFLQAVVRKILISAKCGDRPTLLLSCTFIKVKLIWI